MLRVRRRAILHDLSNKKINLISLRSIANDLTKNIISERETINGTIYNNSSNKNILDNESVLVKQNRTPIASTQNAKQQEYADLRLQRRKVVLERLVSNLRELNERFVIPSKDIDSKSVSSNPLLFSDIYNSKECQLKGINNLKISQKINLALLTLKSHIYAYTATTSELKHPIRIGIKNLSGCEKRPTLLNAIVGDPLTGKQSWYEEFKLRRSKDKDILITYNRYHQGVKNNENFEDRAYNIVDSKDNRKLQIWEIESPILTVYKRETHFENLYKLFNSKNLNKDIDVKKVKLNDLEFLEICDPDTDITQNCNIDGMLNSEREIHDVEFEDWKIPAESLKEDECLDIGDGCHLYLYYTDNDLQFPSDELFPYLIIKDCKLDNTKKGPEILEEVKVKSSSTATHFRIDSAKAEKGNEILMENFANTTEYLKFLNESNILKLTYYLNMTTSNDSIILQNLKILNNILSMKYFNSSSNVQDSSLLLNKLFEKNSNIKYEIQDWSKQSNLFLQNRFHDNLVKYESSKLPWWKMVFINDDIEFYLVDMAQRSLQEDKDSVDFNKSKNFETSLNYIEGKLNIPEELHDNTRKTIVEKLYPDIINIQNEVTKLLSNNLFGIQLPATLIAVFGGYGLYGLDLYSTISIVGLSSAIVVNNISKSWYSMMDKFKEKLTYEVRNEITSKEVKLQSWWNEKYKEKVADLKRGVEVIEEYRQNIEDFEELVKNDDDVAKK